MCDISNCKNNNFNYKSPEDILGSDIKLILDESVNSEKTSCAASSPLREEFRKKFIWNKCAKKLKDLCIPWFIIFMCFCQIFFYWIGNDCIYHRLMLTPAHHWNQLWRYLTYTLLHSDLIHLALNICLQCMVGLILECEQGHWRVAFIYVAGGISGSLVTAFLQPQLSLLGASAAIYALLISHIPHLIKNFHFLSHRFSRIVALIVLCLCDAGFSLYHFNVNHNLNPRICMEAHIAGAITGLFSGFVVLKRLTPAEIK